MKEAILQLKDMTQIFLAINTETHRKYGSLLASDDGKKLEQSNTLHEDQLINYVTEVRALESVMKNCEVTGYVDSKSVQLVITPLTAHLAAMLGQCSRYLQVLDGLDSTGPTEPSQTLRQKLNDASSKALAISPKLQDLLFKAYGFYETAPRGNEPM